MNDMYSSEGVSIKEYWTQVFSKEANLTIFLEITRPILKLCKKIVKCQHRIFPWISMQFFSHFYWESDDMTAIS